MPEEPNLGFYSQNFSPGGHIPGHPPSWLLFPYCLATPCPCGISYLFKLTTQGFVKWLHDITIYIFFRHRVALSFFTVHVFASLFNMTHHSVVFLIVEEGCGAICCLKPL